MNPNVKWPRCAFLVLSFFSILLLAFDSFADFRLSSNSRRVAAASTTQFGIDDVTKLTPGQRSTRQIQGGELQLFQVTVPSGQYLHLAVRPTRIILQVTLFDPAGKQLITTSNPSGGSGPIYVSEIAALSGDYRLEVRSIEDWANPGSFEVGVDELRVASPEDVRRIETERLFAKALKESDGRSFKTAIEDYLKALSGWREIQDSHWEALTEYALGQAYYSAGKLAESDKHYASVLSISLEEDDWRIKAAARNDLGLNASLQRRNDEAITYLNESLRDFEEHGDRRGQASSLNNLAGTYGRMGDLRKAREFVERALPLRQAENFKSGVYNLRNTQGNISDRLGEPYKAREYYLEALKGWLQLDEVKKLDDPNRLANAFNSLAQVCQRLGDWNESDMYYSRALNVPGISAPLRAAILNNQAALYVSLGNSDAAIQLLRAANKELDSLKAPEPDTRASVLLQIGQIQAEAGNLDDAVAQFQLARLANPNKPKLSYILTALGDAWGQLGKLPEALDAYREALEIQQGIEDRRGEALTRQTMARTYALSGDSAKGLKEYETALSLWKTLSDRRGEAAALNGIALAERDNGNLNDALRHSEEVVSILESLRTHISSQQLRTSYFAKHENYYELNINLKMKFWRETKDERYLAQALEASEKSRARSLIETLNEAYTHSTDPLVQHEHEVGRMLRAKLELQANVFSRKHSQEELQRTLKEVSDLDREQDKVRATIQARNPRYSELVQPRFLTLVEFQQQLDEGSVLLEYALGDARSYVWAVTAESIHGFELAGREQIEAAARRVIEALTARNREEKNETWPQRQTRIAKAETDYAAASAELSKLIIEPVVAELGQKRLVIVADGALQLIPFAALPVPSNVMSAQDAKLNPQHKTLGLPSTLRLIDQHEIISLPSASVLALQRRELRDRKPARLAVAVLADPVFDDQDERVAKATGVGNQRRKDMAGLGQGADAPSAPGKKSSSPSVPDPGSALTNALRDVGISDDGKLQRLSLSRREAGAIVRAVRPGQSFSAVDFRASRQTATSPELSKYRIVHFATHGVLDLEHPELSGVVLSMVDEKGKAQDGYLRLHEIYNLNLPAELVVLSACQTGIGKQIKGEGLIALTRGFMYAGAKSVVASLWKVDDAATAELMAEFYRQMLTNKVKPAAALRAAQVKISQQPRWKSPYYWAGFFLQGEWN